MPWPTCRPVTIDDVACHPGHNIGQRYDADGAASRLDDENFWLDIPKAGFYVGVHEETIRRWALEGAVPAAKLGNRGGFRFKREDLERFLERRLPENSVPG